MDKFKYLVNLSTYFRPVEKVAFDKETKSSVWINGRRRNKEGAYERYCDNFESAKTMMMEYAESQVQRARRNLELANSLLGNVKGMKDD